MIFNSLTFLLFVALFIPVYFMLSGKMRLLWALLGSYLFYGWWDWRFLTLIVISSVVDYFLGLTISSEVNANRRKNLLWLSVIVNLGFLGFFKYFDFFTESFIVMLEGLGLQPSVFSLNIILPVGISFYTFQSMSYTIDVYRRKIEPERDLLKFAIFVAFWPQLVAGPIVRARDFLPQLHQNHKFDRQRFVSGTGQILLGFFKKVAIADSLAPFVDQVFSDPAAFTSINLWIGLFFYAFQIYCDFSGYSDIAIGFARILGFDFPDNFRTPYFSKNFSEFWTRWHISLSSWLKDYLYISIGGNRSGKLKTYRNLILTMFLGGLWHGANWTFVFWGLLHGFYLVIQRLTASWFEKLESMLRVPAFLTTAVSIPLVFLLTCFAWLFFRSPDFEVAMLYWKGLVSFGGFSFAEVMNKFVVIKGALLIFFLLLVEIADFKFNFKELVLMNPTFRVVSFALLIWMIAFFGTFGSNAFIYFQF